VPTVKLAGAALEPVAAQEVAGALAVDELGAAGTGVTRRMILRAASTDTGRFITRVGNRVYYSKWNPRIWGKTPALEREVGAAAYRGGWSIPGVADRGDYFHDKLGGNLPHGFDVIDDFRNGVAKSWKSRDLTAAKYKDLPNGIINQGMADVDALAAFQGAVRGGAEVKKDQIETRVLEWIIEPGIANVEQRAALRMLQEYGKQKGIVVNILEMK